jgi:CopG family nickel-responsive transcriptional regulator
MQRVTIALDNELMKEIDRLMKTRGYQNRSEAIRDLARAGIRQMNETNTTAQDCVAALVYVYDHEARALSKRLTRSFHDHHDLSLATMHVHLDHDSCMEVTVLRGKTAEVQHLAGHVMAERGVRYGRLAVVPVEIEERRHPHGGEPSHSHAHVHVRKAG